MPMNLLFYMFFIFLLFLSLLMMSYNLMMMLLLMELIMLMYLFMYINKIMYSGLTLDHIFLLLTMMILEGVFGLMLIIKNNRFYGSFNFNMW